MKLDKDLGILISMATGFTVTTVVAAGITLFMLGATKWAWRVTYAGYLNRKNIK